MDITRDQADDMLGIIRNNAGQAATGKIMYWPKWPVSSPKQLALKIYVQLHEKDTKFRNSVGLPFLLVNQHLVNLREGAGFGELALIGSDSKRMASVFTASPSVVLATLAKKDFLSVERRA